jgi:hypothetical protein
VVSTLALSATLIAGGASYPLDLLTGTCNMDESVVPFVAGDITVAHPGLTVFALITPDAKVRLTATSRGASLTTTLTVQARQLVAETGEVGINLVNDEAAVQDYSPTSDTNFNAAQNSLRSIVNAALTKALGTTTTVSYASGKDVAIPTTTTLENLIPGGNFENTTGIWTANNVTLSTATGWKQVGTYSLKATPNSSSTSSWVSVVVPVSQGQKYTLSGYVRIQAVHGGTPQPGARRLQAIATFQDGSTTSTSLLAQSVQAPNTANTTTRLSVSFTVPWNAVSVAARLVNGASNFNDNSIYLDGVLLTEGDGTDTNGQPLDYFDGDNPVDSLYSYAWTGDRSNSTSVRTPLVDRDPSTLIWSPGTGGMEFLQPIVQAGGFRLIQDIDGSWLLADNDYRVPGQARIGYGMNLLRATDLISKTATQVGGLPLYADAVVLRYAWTDVLGKERTKSDIAAPAGYTKPYVPDVIQAPYPGPGRAAYMLSRLKTRRRQLQVTGLPDFTTRPGQEAVITTVDGGVQVGYVDAVTWDLGNDEMTVITKGLVNTPPASWFNLAPGVAWSASPTGSSWAAETV